MHVLQILLRPSILCLLQLHCNNCNCKKFGREGNTMRAALGFPRVHMVVGLLTVFTLPWGQWQRVASAQKLNPRPIPATIYTYIPRLQSAITTLSQSMGCSLLTDTVLQCRRGRSLQFEPEQAGYRHPPFLTPSLIISSSSARAYSIKSSNKYQKITAKLAA